jgi:hypothetical protein
MMPLLMNFATGLTAGWHGTADGSHNRHCPHMA